MEVGKLLILVSGHKLVPFFLWFQAVQLSQNTFKTLQCKNSLFLNPKIIVTSFQHGKKIYLDYVKNQRLNNCRKS